MTKKTVTLDRKRTDKAVLEHAYHYARWLLNLKETTNDTFFPLFFNESRFLVLKGGGGSGKSIFAGRKIIERCVSEEGHRFLVCRKVARTIRESCFRQLCGQISELYPNLAVKINNGDMFIRFPNGSEILFAGLDDVEKLKSIYNITGVWIEEASEILETDFNQLDIRLRGKTKYYKQIIITFNPISILHWLKKRFFDKVDKRATTHESTYLDNRFLDDEARETLLSFRETDEYYYNVYCLGMWGVVGKSVFSAKKITEQLISISEKGIKPERIGYFEWQAKSQFEPDKVGDFEFVSDGDGFIKIYKTPSVGVPYVIGADTAGDGSDKYVCQVIDNRTGELVCTLRRSLDEDVFSKQLYCLGKYYNEALIALEVNFSTYPVLELERLGYKKQYVREVMDDYTHKLRSAFGFRTDPKTRPVIISGLIKFVREYCNLIPDEDTLHEMLTFVRNREFRPEAEAGAHDDCVMALAIAHFARSQQAFVATVNEEGQKIKWNKSMYEDYRNANEAGKAYLRKIWGTPN